MGHWKGLYFLLYVYIEKEQQKYNVMAKMGVVPSPAKLIPEYINNHENIATKSAFVSINILSVNFQFV